MERVNTSINISSLCVMCWCKICVLLNITKYMTSKSLYNIKTLNIRALKNVKPL